MTAGSLFSGGGGFDLGMERAGFDIKWQVEVDEFCRRVLEKHWPNVKRYGDIRDVRGCDVEPVECLFGGFPCQDISAANPKGKGIEGERSGLWSEYFRLVCEIRPRFVVVENSPTLLERGFGRVLGDLASIGFNAEWEVLSACAFGAPHTRERLFVMAHSTGYGGVRGTLRADGREITERRKTEKRLRDSASLERPLRSSPWDSPEYPVCGMDYGLSKKVGFSILGNAVVPAVAEYVGRRVMEASQ